MAQFDSLIIFPLLWSLVLTLVVYYWLSIEILIPQFAGLGKLRKKKVGSLDYYNQFGFSPISGMSPAVI